MCLRLKSGGKTAALQKPHGYDFPVLLAFGLGVVVAEFEALRRRSTRRRLTGHDLAAWGYVVNVLTPQSGGKTAALQKPHGYDFPVLLAFGLGVEVAEFEALEFSGGGFGEFLQEFDPAGTFVAADTLGDKILQFAD
jgi:hypothetical protein